MVSQANQVQELELKRHQQKARIQWLLLALFAALTGRLYFFLARRKQQNEELNQLNLILKGDNKALIEKIAFWRSKHTTLLPSMPLRRNPLC